MKSNRAVARVLFFYGAALLFAGVLGVKLFFVQVVHGADYRAKAARQYVIPEGSSFNRGSIFFTAKNGSPFSAATMRAGYTLAIKPSLITDPDAVFSAISNIIPIDKTAFMSKAALKDDPYEEIAKELTPDQGDKISALNKDGVILADTKWRYYPAGDTAAQTIGFVGYQGDTLSGQYGLERYYDDVLGGNNTSNVNFFAQLFGDVKPQGASDDAPKQGDIVTYIEPNVQTFIEEQLKELDNEWHPQLAGGIVIDPNTGAIYAMASSPTFNLNDYSKQTDEHVYTNPLVEGVFEMGSIVKALTMGAGLDAGVVTPTTTYNDKGTLLIDGKHISNWDGQGRGPTTTMQEVLNQSLNTGAVFVEQQLGNDLFRDYMKKYGIGEETGIDLPNESAGLISNLNSPRDVEYATAAFGQGIAITPIQITRALAVLANGGLLVTPQVVKEIDYDDGTKKEIAPYPPQRVLKPETSHTITQMLVTVVDKAFAKGTALPHYSIAAKTGTAQLVDKADGGYYADRYLHSFFGYFPAFDPKFLVFYFVVDPQGATYASQTITPHFIDTVKFLINYYNIPPDR